MKHINLVLGGGGARGIAHLGIAQALTENGYTIAGVSGTSIGAMVGCFIAAQIEPKQILELFKDQNVFTMFGSGKKGMMSFKPLKEFILDQHPYRTFEEFEIPFYCTTSNISLGKGELHHQGAFIDKVLASCSLPFIFEPVVIEGETHIDGGMYNNLPVDPFLSAPHPTLAINVSYVKDQFEFNNSIDIAKRTIQLTIFNSVSKNLSKCEHVLDLQELRAFNTLDFHKRDEIYEMGYQAGIKWIQNQSI